MYGSPLIFPTGVEEITSVIQENYGIFSVFAKSDQNLPILTRSYNNIYFIALLALILAVYSL
jgi:hypothetical protein